MLQLFENDDTGLFTCWFFKISFQETCFTETILLISSTIFKQGNNNEVFYD